MDRENEILDFIDRGSWKHSWHLHKDVYGFTDWWNTENLNELISLMHSAKTEGQELIRKADLFLPILKKRLREAVKEE